ncbi:hypothetical protein T01_2213 [Trichinella spiralis]|uniref:Uncharacterized protein n=1 Tax=Trichinella spiralis TaxID=6334 RepID=A0A0V1AWC9_TRISP|nr:hypothetical protein T01_2213 [Trichinella spiralis]
MGQVNHVLPEGTFLPSSSSAYPPSRQAQMTPAYPCSFSGTRFNRRFNALSLLNANISIHRREFFKSLHHWIIRSVVGGRQDPPPSGGSRACLWHLIQAAHSAPVPLSSSENPLCDVPSAHNAISPARGVS